MDDANYIINKIIEEHHKIRDNLKLTGESMNDVEAAITLSKAYSGWTQSSTGELTSKKDMLIRALSALEEGLNIHFDYEEKYLPPLLKEEAIGSFAFTEPDTGSNPKAIKTKGSFRAFWRAFCASSAGISVCLKTAVK